jgi:hypothetical protein
MPSVNAEEVRHKMISKDLSRLIQQEGNQEESSEMQSLIKKLKDKQFFTWNGDRHKEQSNPRNSNTHGYCCFNHIIGLPSKNGKEYPMFDYEHMMYKALMDNPFLNSDIKSLPRPESVMEREKRKKEMANATYADFKNKHVWVKKATGLGVTEFMLRFMAWLCLRNDDYRNSQMVIVTGPNIDIAIKLIKRMKALFERHGITFDSKETTLELNGCSIEAYPSNHIDAFRSLSNPKFILIDEGDFFRKNEQEEVRMVAERYIGKSDPFIVIVSTPNAPNGLMHKLEKESFETCIYKKVFLDYTYGIDKIYTQEEIEKAKKSPSFPREYQLQYLGLEGNCLSSTAIDRCILLGEQMEKTAPLDNWDIITKYVLSVDIGWGSSATAIMVSRFVNGKVQIIYSKEFARPLFQNIIDEIWRLKTKCNNNLQNILMDASNTELYTTLCSEFKQNPSLKYLSDKQAWAKKINQPLENYLFIVPIPFSVHGRNILNHTQRMIEEQEDGNAMVAINKRFEDLITSCRSAYAVEDKLDKERTVFPDTFDALRMNLSYYRMEN